MTFCKFAAEVFEGIPNLYVYLDDLLVFSDDHAEHIQIVDQVFQRLAKYGLALALPKCTFAQPSVEFLGYTIYEFYHMHMCV